LVTLKTARHRKRLSASTSDGVDQDGKHEQPIEALETVAPQRLRREPGTAEPRKPFTSSSGAETSIDCVSFADISSYERSADINNAVSYLCVCVAWLVTGLQCLQISLKRCILHFIIITDFLQITSVACFQNNLKAVLLRLLQHVCSI